MIGSARLDSEAVEQGIITSISPKLSIFSCAISAASRGSEICSVEEEAVVQGRVPDPTFASHFH
jgi:hypothetical protein